MANDTHRNPDDPYPAQNRDPTRKQAPGYDDTQHQQGQRRNTDVERGTDKPRKTPVDNE